VQIEQHQKEILRNLESWHRKPLLQKVYAQFYARIAAHIDQNAPGKVVELGSGIGNLKAVVPAAVLTDLFPNPWLDLVCDAYQLPFPDGSVSHLVLFDVFHHLERPSAFFKEARRVLRPGGKIVLFEPYISLLGLFVYGIVHHEPVAFFRSIDHADKPPSESRYYAAQGNASRLFFAKHRPAWLEEWCVVHREILPAFTYLLTGGYSKPSLISPGLFPWIEKLQEKAGVFPRLFGTRCLIVLSPQNRSNSF